MTCTSLSWGVNWSWTKRIITVPKIKVTWEINILKDLHISETRKTHLKQKEYVTFNKLSCLKHCTTTEMHQSFNILSTMTHVIAAARFTALQNEKWRHLIQCFARQYMHICYDLCTIFLSSTGTRKTASNE